jgi:hypothetical protein
MLGIAVKICMQHRDHPGPFLGNGSLILVPDNGDASPRNIPPGRFIAALQAIDVGISARDWTGAGEGNRTLVFSLEGCCSTIELHPRGARSPITPHHPPQPPMGRFKDLNRPGFAAYIDVFINNERR